MDLANGPEEVVYMVAMLSAVVRDFCRASGSRTTIETKKVFRFRRCDLFRLKNVSLT